MIEKKIVRERFMEYKIKDYVNKILDDVPVEDVFLEKTPMGEKITISTPTPGLVIGSRGANITKLTANIKEHFKLESPQVKISVLENPNLSAIIIAKRIANSFRRYGSQRFKLSGYKSIENTMRSGAAGIEIVLSGKIPSARAKSWRFVGGYIKKTGYPSDFFVDHAVEDVQLKMGTLGIKVSVMKKDVPLPQKVTLKEINTPNSDEAGSVESNAVEVVDKNVVVKKDIDKSKTLENKVEQTSIKTNKGVASTTSDKKEKEVIKSKVAKTSDNNENKKEDRETKTNKVSNKE